MRRLIIEEPVSRPARWSPRVASFSLAVTVIAVLLLRSQRVEYPAGFAALGMGLLFAILAILLAIFGFMRIWREGRQGLGSAIKGMILSLLILAYPSYFAVLAVLRPPINDITTDTENPPAFSRSHAALDARQGHVPPDPPPEVREAQRAAYAHIAPISLDLPPEETFDLVRKAAGNLGWTIIETAGPGGRMGTGRIEAVDRTFLLRLQDDITIRIRPRADGTRVDIRSASRLGSHDFGTNARRIRRFLDEVSNLAIASK